MTFRSLVFILAAAIPVVVAGCGASEPREAPAADLVTYEGPDRQERLVAAAKQEGQLTIYTSSPSEDFNPVQEAFGRKYGIKITFWRAASEAVLIRALQESRGNRHVVDVIETNGPELEGAHREGLLQPVKSPHHSNLMASAAPPHAEWVGTRLHVFVQAYNTRMVKREDLPKTWDDLADPRWKRMLGIEQEDSDWLAGVFSQIGEEHGKALFERIVTANGVSTRKGHTLLTQLVASGEVPLALTVYSYKAEQLKKEGAPLDWFTVGKPIARLNGIGVARRAPHPNAAALFYDFLISEEGQRIIAAREHVPTSLTVDTPLTKVPMTVVDARMSIDEYDKWKSLYAGFFIRAR